MRTRNSAARSMMGIASPTGSHLPVLSQEVAATAGLVVEHGAGLYSTPFLARAGARVLCCETHPGWREWADWIYGGSAEFADFPTTLTRLRDAAVVFIDGQAKERLPLLLACLEVGVPSIIMHDTSRHDWRHYGLKPHYFEHERYDVSHYAEDSHRTTLWKRKV